MSDRIRPFRKVMAANRGEIAIRIFRACTELGLKTLAVYSHEDRLSIHRYKADEAFEIGRAGDPIGAYLDQEALLKLALAQGVDAIHPGYGFLAENAAFARRCAEVGVVFIGPSPSALATFGDKTAARRLAVEAGVPVVPGLDHPVRDVSEVHGFAAAHGFPIMLKAAFGGGGRGMRVIERAEDIDEAFARASGEAKAAFGDGSVFCERLIRRAKHIEVQLLADAEGHCVHLFERDCSIQRRHQKVIEIAPAVTLTDTMREALYQAALRIARASLYVNAGTVEFLVEGDQFYFIEVNPRIQVEHTVTEQITGRDLVQAQIRVAQGYRLNDPEVGIPNQAAITRQGVSIQLRVTSEDPERDFRPDTGKILAYRSAAGFGIRLDTGIGGAGTVISSDYDTLIVKLIATGLTFQQAVAKASRSLHEFRIRGVKTNIPFLDKVLSHPAFLSGQTYTRFVDDNPDLTRFSPRRDRGTKLLKGLAHVIVNGPPGLDRRYPRPQPLFLPQPPAAPASTPPDSPAMAAFRAHGASGLSKWLKAQPALLLTDTTFRDAHQSLLATRVRTADMAAVAPATAHHLGQLFSVEMWGGATFDVAYRFLREDPWQRLDTLRAAMPNHLLQMLLRGANAVGYANYPDNIVRRFIKEAARRGVDIFRVFDALNWLPNMALALEEVAACGKVAEAAICYTGDILDPRRTKFTLDYYTQLAADLARHGAHIIAIKDMAGLLKPAAARVLIPAIREASGLPVHLHTHDTSGNGLSTYLLAADAGVDVVDCALASVSGLTSQPSLDALLVALEHHPRAPQGFDMRALQDLSDYWERVRDLYYPFESGLKACTAEVYWHEIPGGQYSNLKAQAISLGLGERFGEIKQRYRDVNDALGDIIKVTPTSKMVADFAMFLVQNNLTIDEAITRADRLNFPKSVTEFFSGQLGQPPGGFPPDLRRAVMRGQPVIDGRAGDTLPPHDFDAASARLHKRLNRPPREDELLADALYPAVMKEYLDVRGQLGDLSLLPTQHFLYGLEPGEEVDIEIEPGKTLIVKLGAIGDLDPQGQRIVYFELNGQPREVVVRDLSVESDTAQRPQADPNDPSHLGASMPGKVIQVLAQPGQAVAASQTLIIVEAMKMETALKAPQSGTVLTVLAQPGDRVQAGDLLLRLAPNP